MKRMNTILWLCITLIAFISVSCDDDEQEQLDERIISFWVLEDVYCSVNASEDYISDIIKDKLKSDFLFFQDTIQFIDNGYFLEGEHIIKDNHFDDLDLLPYGRKFAAYNGILTIYPAVYESTTSYPVAYKFDDTGNLALSPDVAIFFDWKEYLKSIDRYSQDITVDNILYTQVYKRISRSELKR